MNKMIAYNLNITQGGKNNKRLHEYQISYNLELEQG